MDRFEHDYNIFKDAVASIDNAKDNSELSAIDNKIGTALKSLQVGILAVAREAKDKVLQKRGTL